jgi:hypothetical protein
MKKHEIITNEIKLLKEEVATLRSRAFNDIGNGSFTIQDGYLEGLFDAYCEVWSRLVLLIDSIERGYIFENH